MTPSAGEGVDEPVEIVEHESDWAEQAEHLIQQLRRLLGAALDIQHIGSTAVPGLAAKPVLDLQAAVPADRHDDVARHLRDLDFIDLGEAGVPGRRYLRRRTRRPLVNLHLTDPDGQLWQDNLLLRDHLRSHPDDAHRYADLKHRAAADHPSLVAYSQAKAHLVEELLGRARALAPTSTDSARRRQAGCAGCSAEANDLSGP